MELIVSVCGLVVCIAATVFAVSILAVGTRNLWKGW